MTGSWNKANTSVALGKLVLDLGAVNRVTYHPDGTTAESDTTHTVMLGIVACVLAPTHMDKGLIAQYTLIHDLVEAKVGDTNTFDISEEGLREKEERETKALEELNAEFAYTPWMLRTLRAYEEQEVTEARYVRYLDKMMPKITHVLNACATMVALDKSLGDMRRAHEEQLRALNYKYPDIAPYMSHLMAEVMEMAEKCHPDAA